MANRELKMLNLDFNNIRPLGSVNDGFEEMVCQLAHRMNVPGGKRFVRNGRPDGGVECYWELENGDLWMWQAKFFPSALGASQFNQINDSVVTAFSLHKNIKRYYIAFPLDLPDNGKAKTKSARKRYEEKVSQWQKLEGAEETEFIFWGKHELLDILSEKENEGRVYFWFNKDEFTAEDFKNQNKKAIDALGTRYTPELNVELDIAKTFDGLSRNTRFAERFKSNLLKCKKAWQWIHPAEDDRKSNVYDNLEKKVSDFIDECGKIIFEGIERLPIDILRTKIQSTSMAAQAFITYLEDKPTKTDEKKDNSHTISNVREFYFELSDFLDYLEEPECKVANTPILLVSGDAGMGKSHLLADVVERRREDGRYSLLFLGQRFNAQEDPWTQIFKQQKFTGSEEEYLQALEAKAESTGHRIIIFIDALNEGGGKVLWDSYIVSFINQIKEHPWLGLVMSIRSTYVRAIFGDKKVDGVQRITHRGFESRSFDAIKLYFKNYNIALPSVPLLLPEFQNPLFLKLFCEGLSKNGLTKIDEGMRGISSVISLFINGVEKDLSSPHKKNYSSDLHVVREAVNVLIDYQVENLTTVVPIAKAIELTDGVRTDKFGNGDLLDELLSYSVLTKDMQYGEGKQYEEVVYLSYERFNDFLTAQRLLEKSESAEVAVKKIIKDKRDIWYYAGLLESFAIIIPEKEGRELYEILPEYHNNDTVVDSVIKSLLWRKKSTICKDLVDFFNEVLNDQSSLNFLGVLIQVGPTVNHYFNAEFLHRNLMQWSMAERDSQWSIDMKRISGNGSPVDTLIAWAKEYYGQAKIDSESKYLTAIVLTWFTTCMDRGIRDNASKGLISLVRDDVDLMIKLVEKFDGVNDPYVVERIYAAAYGCALLSKTANRLPELAQSVYAHIFDVEGEVYPDAMVRDYAKGVIEYTLTKYPDLQLGDKTFVPPYNSSFSEEFPTDEEVRAYSKKDKDGKWITPGIDDILSSMVTEHGYTLYGDFGRYVFQSHLYGWHLDPQKLSNLAVKWIMERYGYKEELFGKYDDMVGTGRMRNTSLGERVGKKYQWIALHEMMARLSDNYPLHDSWYDDRVVSYNGTWEPCIRDFDPTMLVQKRITHWFEPESKYWWNNQKYEEWNCEMAEWASNDINLPDPASVIETVDEKGTHWLALQAMPDWVEPHEKDANVYRCLWYQIRSFIIDEDKCDKFLRWASKQNFTGRWMPEQSDRYEMFSREFYWSPAYKYYEAEGITVREIYDRKNNKKIADVELPCINFLWESEYDYSKQDTLSYLKPSKQLFEGMGMRYSDTDGELLDADGDLLCFDACANHDSHEYLLVRKDAFIRYLQSNHKKIVWALIGEKNLMGSMISHSEWLEMSGIYYLDSSNEVKGSMTTYLEGKPLHS